MHPIVVVAYARADSLKRLLQSLASAFYPSADIPLIISIDYSETNNDVLEVANQFDWHFGDKQVRYSNVNQGLKKHILSCASLALEYGSVIVLEDDLFVSPNFYNYATEALNFADKKAYIGGISLYNHCLNVHCNMDFKALEDGYDNWYMQFASSWGQAWSKDQFEQFSEWYKENQTINEELNIPPYVVSWSDKSWLKYFIAYLIEKDRYFLYPKISLTTNFGELGTHLSEHSTAFQVPILAGEKKTYNFGDIENSLAVYDAYYENCNLHKHLKIPKENLIVDLYGTKQSNPGTEFILSKNHYPFEIIRSFGRRLRPVDSNILQDIQGAELFLYDTRKPGQHKKNRSNLLNEIQYHTKVLSHRNTYILFRHVVKKKLESIFRSRFK